MAHMARVAGTDYAVAGGKTLIDGTAYSVVATREVEKTVVVSGIASSSAGWSLTLNDARFDWDKYKVKKVVIACKKNATFNQDDYRVLYAVYEDDGAVSYTGSYYGSIQDGAISITATTNGKLEIKSARNSLGQLINLNFNSVNYTIVLEAKT